MIEFQVLNTQIPFNVEDDSPLLPFIQKINVVPKWPMDRMNEDKVSFILM